MPGDTPFWRKASLGEGGTLNFPIDIARALGIAQKKATLYFFLEEDRVVIVQEHDFPDYLRKRKK